MVETTPACIKLVAADGTLLDMNSAGLAMVEADQLGERQRELRLRPSSAMSIGTPSGNSMSRCAGASGGRWSSRLPVFEGTRRRVETHAVPLRWPGGGFVQLAITHDITERKRAEDIIRESEERFRATFNQAAVGVAHVGMDHQTLWVNPGLCAMLGYTEAELRERTSST